MIPLDPITASYDDAFRRAEQANTEVYGELSGFGAAAHERRMELLAGLDLGDLGDATVVDYGVGPWGFAAVFPALRACRRGIGLDISEVALAISRRVDTDPRFEFRSSRGDVLPLEDASVDVVWAGEAIEHVDVPAVFLDEVHRVLRPGGQLILTTPNPRAATYLAAGDEFGLGPEHIALMPYSRLIDLVTRRFEVVVAHGYNTSLHFSVDDSPMFDSAAHTAWARQFVDAPQFASGVLVHARRDDTPAAPRRTVQRVYVASATDVVTAGEWRQCHLHEAMWGSWADSPSSSLRVRVPAAATSVALLLWAHDWSGVADVTAGDRAERIDLFSARAGFRRVELGDLPRGGEVVVRPAGTHDPRSSAAQVIVFAVFFAV